MKKILSGILITSCVLSMGLTSYAKESVPIEDMEVMIDNSNNEIAVSLFEPLMELDRHEVAVTKNQNLSEECLNLLNTSYQELIDYAEVNDIPLNLTLETFVYEYQTRAYASVEDYAQIYYSLLVPMQENQATTRSGGSSDYYYDIGTSLPSDVTPNYDKYNLLETVEKGDIIYEANGGFGITGHIAIVEGFYYNSSRDITYIRIIEAISDGVVRGLLDDTRVDERDGYVLRVSGATETIINNAVSFCIGEIGSSYFIDFQKDTSSSETDWYCSELVWASYYNQEIDIERDSFLSEPGITPRDIYNGNNTYEINFK